MDSSTLVDAGSVSVIGNCSGRLTVVTITAASPRFALALFEFNRPWLAESTTPGTSVVSNSKLAVSKLGHGGGHDLRATRSHQGFNWGNFGDIPPQPLAAICFTIAAGSAVSGTK